MAQRSSLPPPSDVPLVDLAALAERLRRWRQWRGVSQAALAQRAGVDAMVLSRLGAQHKTGLSVETVARLARVCGWTLGQLCGLEPLPAIPQPPAAYTPLADGLPAWLAGGLPTTTEDRRLAAHLLAWQVRGATDAAIAESLTAWGITPLMGRLPWRPETVQACLWRWTQGTKQARRAVLLEYGFAKEARQHGAWWRQHQAQR